jgi:hypothetical protein
VTRIEASAGLIVDAVQLNVLGKDNVELAVNAHFHGSVVVSGTAHFNLNTQWKLDQESGRFQISTYTECSYVLLQRASLG